MVEFIGEELVGLGIDLKTRKWNLIYIYLHRVKACVDMNVENEEDTGVKVEHVDCSNAFNTSQVFV